MGKYWRSRPLVFHCSLFMQISKVDLHAASPGEFSMKTDLLAPIVGQGLFYWVVHAIQVIAKPFKRSAWTVACDFDEHHQARAALNQRTHGGLIASTLDHIAFPVTGCKSIIGLTRAIVKSCHIRNLPSTIHASRTWPTRPLTLPQTGYRLRPKLSPRGIT